jgi:hypothetical protein
VPLIRTQEVVILGWKPGEGDDRARSGNVRIWPMSARPIMPIDVGLRPSR